MDDRGTNARFYGLVWPHLGLVLRSAYILCRNSADAEDLAQETMLKAFGAMDRFQDGTNAIAWLMTILRHTWIDTLRARKSEVPTIGLEDLKAELADSPHHNESDEQQLWPDPQRMLDAFTDEEVIVALQQVPADIRWVLLLADVQQLPQEEAARIVAVPLGTIKSRLHRGRAMLRQALLTKAPPLRGFARKPAPASE